MPCVEMQSLKILKSTVWLLNWWTGTSLAESIIHTPRPPHAHTHTQTFKTLTAILSFFFFSVWPHSTPVYSHNIIDPVKGPRFIFLCDGNSHWTHKLCARRKLARQHRLLYSTATIEDHNGVLLRQWHTTQDYTKMGLKETQMKAEQGGDHHLLDITLL